jgi:hypothetical protein
MSDAPPWPNFPLHYYFILLCPIFITDLLSMLPMILYELSHCSCILHNVRLWHKLWALPRYYHPRKRKKKVLKPPGTCQPGPRRTSQTLFAAAWFFYKMSRHTKCSATKPLERWFVAAGHYVFTKPVLPKWHCVPPPSYLTPTPILLVWTATHPSAWQTTLINLMMTCR